MTEILKTWKRQLEQTPQEPAWHGEGSVWNHTRLVLDAMQALPEYRSADAQTRKILYLAAALHDVGKIHATRKEDGRWVSPGHARISAQMARQLLWQDYGLCGTVSSQRLREAVCGLIRYHTLPVHAFDEPDGRLRLLRFAANGSLAPGLTVKNLCLLAKADLLGRICQDQQEQLEKLALCEELAREAGCYEGPYPFPTDHTRYSYLSGRDVPMDYPLYENTWGPVILMSGLPGTGKDTWIREHCPDLPMISLDAIREEIFVSPTEDQGKVIELARERAREYLRRRQRFVWNATNLSPVARSKPLALFQDYGAAVETVYLETEWQEQLRRNRSRKAAVPETVICGMLELLSPPESKESHTVHWLCT